MNSIQAVLDAYVPSPEIPLSHTDPYTLLIAVLLSAQCTDVRVNSVTPPLFKEASTPEQMIQLPVEEIEALIRTCGLYRTKAKAILALSHILVKKYKGKVPSTLKALEALPGVGHKTASVVLCQAFHKPAFPVDTHIHRCAKRWGLSQSRTLEETERDLKAFFPKSSWAKAHLQIILFARKYCPARAHNPSLCPMCRRLLTL